MPIEFRCPSCSKLLRTPDESAGKKAKCPQCGGIADVPLTSPVPSAGSGVSPGLNDPLAPLPPVLQASTGSGLPPGKSPASPFDSPASTNPYASPAPILATPTASVSRGPLVPTRISFDRIFESVWAVFKPQVGQMAVFGLVFLGVNIVLQIIGQGGSLAAQSTGEWTIIVAFTAVNTIFGLLVQTWFTIGSAIYMLKAMRNEAPSINDLGRAGPFYVRAVLLQLVIVLVSLVILTVCLAPAGMLYFVADRQQAAIIAAVIGAFVAAIPLLYVFYRWFLGMYFIVDRNLGVMDSLSQSATFMAGNKLIAFLILLVIGVAGGLFALLTCCIGYIVLVPYGSLTMAAIYLSATGQPWGTSITNRMS